MNEWVPVVAIGSHVMLMDYEGAPMLISIPMVAATCAPDWEAGEVDVSTSAFSNTQEMIEYAANVGAVLDAEVGEIIDSIRG